MIKAKRIYCIEGHWDYGDREVEPTVEPILHMLRSMGHWEQFARRDCATSEECFFFLDREWTRCKEGSILYFATHGKSGELWLSEDQVITLATLSAKQIDCTNCHVHFGGCNVLAGYDEAKIRSFLNSTSANYVSGYSRQAGWTNILDAPALALELLFFSSICTNSIDLADGRSKRKMLALVDKLRDSFSDCGFELFTRWD